MDQDDTEIFKEMMKDVKPLPGKKPASSSRSPLKIQKKRNDDLLASTPSPKKYLSSGSHEIDARTADRLRKGKIKIEARLDLHGLNQNEAHKALNNFLCNAYESNKRCVLVITGKGIRAQQTEGQEEFWTRPQSGVLRQKLPDWLALPLVKDIVLKLQLARPEHGGNGAFYILLRRKREN